MNLSEAQVSALLHLVYRAFVDIRLLGCEGSSEQAADLADAFHNLPLALRGGDFDWDFHELLLAGYSEKYSSSKRPTDYDGLLKEIRSGAYRGG